MNSVEKTLQERGARYGDFADHAEIAQGLQFVMRHAGGWNRLNPTQAQALTVIADKIARILSGDPNYDDNWHDIQGYAKLVEDRLPGRVSANDNNADMAQEIARRFHAGLVQSPAWVTGTGQVVRENRCPCGVAPAGQCIHGAGCHDG